MDRPYGVPRTEEERRARHYEKYGSTDLPPRGTGLGAGLPTGKSYKVAGVLITLIGIGVAAFGFRK